MPDISKISEFWQYLWAKSCSDLWKFTVR